MEGNIYVKEDKIVTISQDFLETKEEYDAKGMYVLPGFIDPHVHFSLTVGGYTSVDDFYNGSIAAAFGGITTYIDFLDPIYHESEIEKKFENRSVLAKESVIDYAFHGTIANPKDEPIKIVEKMKILGIPTLKLFTTYSNTDRRTPDGYIDKLLGISKECGVRILVHAENDGMIVGEKNIQICEHERVRPAIAEISEVIKLAEMTKYRDGLLYIVHTSCGTTIERLLKGYGELLNKEIMMESCPHYFTFSSEIYKKKEGSLYTMNPPLRDEKEKHKLIDHIDDVYTIGTDHCSFNKKDKKQIYIDEIPMGIGGVEHSFVLMFSFFGSKIIDKFTKHIAKAHGLYPNKGTLLPGADADIVIFNPKGAWSIGQHHSKADYTPYVGMDVRGKIISTISRGKFVVKDGVFIGGRGKYIKRGWNRSEGHHKCQNLRL